MPAINAVPDDVPIVSSDARVLPMRRVCDLVTLSDADLARVRDAVERVLTDVGVVVPSGHIRERLRAAGAIVDDADQRVRLAPDLETAALARAPSELRLGARDPAAELLVDGSLAWLGGAVAKTVVDLGSGDPRPSGPTDRVDAARLVDATPQLALVASPASSPAIAADLLAATSKHVQIDVPTDVPTARAVGEVARIAAGGGRSAVSAVLRLDTQLRLDHLDAATALAEVGMPIGVVAGPDPGGAPDRAAGAFVSRAAGAVAGAVCLQLLVPDHPTFVGCAAPSMPWAHAAWVQLARSLGMRASLGAFPTASAASDWRAGSQGGLAATIGWMAPPDLLSGAGLRAGGRVSSPAAMLLDSELFDLIRQIPLGFDVDEDTLAVQVIDDVGPAEHYLGEQHTLRHFRETWMSRFMDTSTWESWEEAGRPEAPGHAADRARELLASHEPMPLPPGAWERIQEVIAQHGHDR